MKTSVFLILLFLSLSINAQVSIYVADSEIKGLFGTEIQISRFSISGGWRPAKIQFPEKQIHSFSTALTYYQPFDEYLSFYLSTGLTSKGISYLDGFNVISEPSMIVTAGLSIYLHGACERISNNWNVAAGCGLNTDGVRKLMTFDIILKYIIIKWNQ